MGSRICSSVVHTGVGDTCPLDRTGEDTHLVAINKGHLEERASRVEAGGVYSHTDSGLYSDSVDGNSFCGGVSDEEMQILWMGSPKR